MQKQTVKVILLTKHKVELTIWTETEDVLEAEEILREALENPKHHPDSKLENFSIADVLNMDVWSEEVASFD